MFKSTTTAYTVATQTLVDLMATASVGETITFDQMSSALGFSVQKHRYILQRAMSLLMDAGGIRFDSVHRVGYKRMNLNDAVGATDRALRRVRRLAKSSREKLEKQLSGANDVDDKTRADINNRLSLLGTVEAISRVNIVKEIAKISDDRVIPFGRVLEAITKM